MREVRERGQEGGKGGSKREERRKEQREGGRKKPSFGSSFFATGFTYREQIFTWLALSTSASKISTSEDLITEV